MAPKLIDGMGMDESLRTYMVNGYHAVLEMAISELKTGFLRKYPQYTLCSIMYECTVWTC